MSLERDSKKQSIHNFPAMVNEHPESKTAQFRGSFVKLPASILFISPSIKYNVFSFLNGV